MVVCNYCGRKLLKNFNYCPNCGRQLVRICGNCKEPTKDSWDFCTNCGKNVIPDLDVKPTKKTIIVSLDNKGDYTSVNKALEKSKEGDLILIKEGTYNDSFDITKKVFLEGEGDVRFILDSSSCCNIYQKCQIKNIKFESDIDNDTTKENSILLNIYEYVLLIDCKVSNSSIGINVCKEASSVIVKNSNFSELKSAIYIKKNYCNLSIENSSLKDSFTALDLNDDIHSCISKNNFHNNTVAISSKNLSEDIIKDNTFKDNYLDSLYHNKAQESGCASFYDNYIVSNPEVYFKTRSEIYFVLYKQFENNDNELVNTFITSYKMLIKTFIKSFNLLTEIDESKSLQDIISLLSSDYKELLLFEFVHLLNTINYKLSQGDNEKLYNLFSLDMDYNNFVQSYSPTKEVQDFLNYEKQYSTLPQYNIGICATMSAGKSTFINSILGDEILPTGNAATTAAVSTIYNYDYLNIPLLSVATTYNNISFTSKDINNDLLEKWNSDTRVNRMYLQSNITDFENTEKLITFNDTPGTNNSGDFNHHDTTINFLSENTMDAIIFVSNTEHLNTNDERDLLCELKEKAIKKDTSILFILNKADTIDWEKENLEDIKKEYIEYLNELGYENATVVPVSSKAAKLFKMAINGKSNQFTFKDIQDFMINLNLFTTELNFAKEERKCCNTITSLNIMGQEFSIKDVQLALNHTGIYDVEDEIKKLILKK